MRPRRSRPRRSSFRMQSDDGTGSAARRPDRPRSRTSGSSSAISSSRSSVSSSSSPASGSETVPFSGSGCCSLRAISSASMPASASIWCRRSSVPERRCGASSPRTRSSPSMSAKLTFHSGDGDRRPALDLRDRLVESAPARLTLGERNGWILVRAKERLPGPGRCPFGRSDKFVGFDRRNTRMPDRFVHAVDDGAPPGDEVVRRAREQSTCSRIAYPTRRACNNGSGRSSASGLPARS